MAIIQSKPAVILLCEDDAGDRELVRRAFEDSRLCNDLRTVTDGEQALDYLTRRGAYADTDVAPEPDLILLDLNMPKIDGKEVLAKIKDNPRLKRIPVVVLTTSRQEEDVLRTYSLGVNSYIEKPVTMERFIEVVRKLGEYWFQIVVLPPHTGNDKDNGNG